MSRPAFCLAVLLAFPIVTSASDPQPDPVEAALKLQKTIAAANDLLDANMPSEAVNVLEVELSNADGNKAFLALLRRAYAAEVRALEAKPTADPNRLAQSRRKLALLGGKVDEAVAVPIALPASDDSLKTARTLFNQGKYAEAAERFAAGKQAGFTESDAAAWAYCRIKLAAEKVNAAKCDTATASAAETDVAAAMQLAPNNADLQKVGRSVIAVARQRQSGLSAPVNLASPGRESGESVIETASFRVRFQGSRDTADAVAKAAESKRATIFERWSGPPAGAWEPKCEILIHANAEAYAKAAGRPATATGHATVKLTNGRATERRIELRADDASMVTNALPRELTHIILADLFPTTPPPKWAEEGMAVLAGDADEIARFTRKLPDCYRDAQLFPMASLLELKEFPDAARITGFYCESVSVVEYLMKLGGERNFTIFLRDCQRYGTASALKRNYNLDGPGALEAAWKQAALSSARGQQP